MNPRISQGQAIRSVFGRALVIQRMGAPLARCARSMIPQPGRWSPPTPVSPRPPGRLWAMQRRTGRGRAILPLALAVFGFGISFGVLARSAGLGVVAPIVMSATTFAGSAQFAAVSIAGAGGSVGTAVAAALLLNARYVPIGISVAPSLGGPLWRRFLLGQLMVDESWAL